MSWLEGLSSAVAADANGSLAASGIAAGFASGHAASVAASRAYGIRTRLALAAG